MKKFIELLNEYDPYIASDGEIRDNFWYFIYKGGSAILPKEIGKLKIISKEYGFIKWLVENDKIDLESYCRITSIERKGEKDVYRDEVDSLLMLLSIQDKPIRFLCEILK